MELQTPRRSVSPAKVAPSSQEDTNFVFDKNIVVNKDVNGIAITEDNQLLLALGAGSYGGIGKLDIDSEQLTVHQRGKPYRQIMVDNNGCVQATTQNTIHTYAMDNLDQVKSVVQPGPCLWGLCQTPDNQLIFADIKKKKVYKRGDEGDSMIVTKSNENKIESIWSLACGRDRLYISDRKKRQVVCTQLDGTLLWREKLGRPFPKYRKALENMADDYFGGLCIDTKGNLLVCDTANNKLTQLTPEGVMTHNSNLNLDHPAHVAVNRGCLVIVNNPTLLDCVVKIYRQSTTL